MARQLDRAGRFLVVAAVVFLLPVYLFDHELIAPEGRPSRPRPRPAAGPRFRAAGLGNLRPAAAAQVGRSWSGSRSRIRPRPIANRRLGVDVDHGGATAPTPAGHRPSTARLAVHAGLVWLGRQRRLVACLALAAIAIDHRAGRAGLQLHGPPAGRRRVADRSW